MKYLVAIMCTFVSLSAIGREHEAVCEYANHKEDILVSFSCKIEYSQTNVSVVPLKPATIFKSKYTWIVFNGSMNGWSMMGVNLKGITKDLQVFEDVNVIHNEHGRTTEIFFAKQTDDGNVISFGATNIK